jgi:predicted amidohydrolase
MNCYVACGYAENDNGKFYNSAVVVNRTGEPVLNVRKKHLFETDKTWAEEG